MAKDRTGFLLDADGNYTFTIGETRLQEAKLIVESSQNDFKHYPLVGCNSRTWENSVMTRQEAQRVIKQQLEADGLKYSDYELLIESNG